MTVLLVAVMAMALWLVLQPSRGLSGRVHRALNGGLNVEARVQRRWPFGRGGPLERGLPLGSASGYRGENLAVSMTVVVQQLAALLKGGRSPTRLWEEIWLLYVGKRAVASTSNPELSPGSATVLSAARSAALMGAPVAEAIRSAVPAAFAKSGSCEPKVWAELAACFDIAEASGCPLAEVLTRFAAQLEVEDDAEAARQTALAGPKATVTLLTWLPMLGLGLGMLLGVDLLAILLGTPIGMASLAAGIALMVAGRVWSARLVQGAAAVGAG